MMRFTAALGNLGDRLGSTARGGDPVKRSRDARSEHDDSVLIPGAAEAGCGIADILHCRIQKVDGFESTLREETNMQAVG